MPEPFANPRYAPCESPDLQGESCVTLLESDFDVYLDDIAMFCEMAGNDPAQCDIREENKP